MKIWTSVHSHYFIKFGYTERLILTSLRLRSDYFPIKWLWCRFTESFAMSSAVPILTKFANNTASRIQQRSKQRCRLLCCLDSKTRPALQICIVMLQQGLFFDLDVACNLLLVRLLLLTVQLATIYYKNLHLCRIPPCLNLLTCLLRRFRPTCLDLETFQDLETF